jgi:Ni/Co efflux regulator RcnB
MKACSLAALGRERKRMNQLLRRTGLAALASALLATSAIAVAQPNNYPGQRDDRQQGRHVQQGPHGQSHANRPGYRPEPPRAQGPQYRPGGPQMESHRGAGPDRRWHRGSRVPPQYRTRHYVVDDWRGHHLSAPPRGYHWVQNGSDYLLVAIATGVIAQLILNH